MAWVSGTSADNQFQDVQFGHAGAKANADNEKAVAKNKYLRESGAIVPESFDNIGELIRTTFENHTGLSVASLHTHYTDIVAPRLQALVT